MLYSFHMGGVPSLSPLDMTPVPSSLWISLYHLPSLQMLSEPHLLPGTLLCFNLSFHLELSPPHPPALPKATRHHHRHSCLDS